MVSTSSHRAEKGKGMHKVTSIRDASQVVTSKQGLVGIECNHTTTNPLRVSNMAKPRAIEVNTSVKYESKQTSICK